MRICVLTSAHPPLDVRIFMKEARSLAGAGHEVEIVSSAAWNGEREGVVFSGLGFSTWSKPFRMTLGVLRVLAAALGRKADVYHFHDPELIPAGLVLRALGRRVVYDMHEDFPRVLASRQRMRRKWPEPLLRALEWLAEKVENLSLRTATGLVSAEPAILSRALDLNSNCVVVQNFPLPEEFRDFSVRPWEERPPVLAYVGAISKMRGLFEMLDAVDRPECRGLTLKLGGAFSPPSLQGEAAARPGWAKVEALGYLDRPGVLSLMGEAKAGLLLLHPNPWYKVAYPVKLFEYMGAGVPVIASDFPLLRDIVSQAGCGILVDPLDPAAIAGAIQWIMSHPREARDMGRRGREAVLSRYNWEPERLKLLSFYERLSKGGS